MRFNIQGTLLNAAIQASLVAVLVGAVHRFVGWWHPGYLLAASGLIALEAGFVHYTFRRDRLWLSEVARYMVPEFVVLVALMRVATTLSLGANTVTAAARQWLFDPLSIFDPLFVIFIGVGLLVGWLAHTTMHDLAVLAPRSDDMPITRDDDQRSMYIVAEDRAVALRALSRRLVIGGVVLLLSLGVEAVNIEQIGGPSQPISNLSAGGALLYLISSFLLYSQMRLALLQARWQREGAQIAPSVTRHWNRTSWLIIVGIALLMLLLPRTYGMGLLDTMRAMFGWIGYLLIVVGYIIVWFLSLLAIIPALLLSLFAPQGSNQAAPAPPPFVPPPAPDHAQYAPMLPATILFWVCMLLLVGYAVGLVLQRHPGLWQAVVNFAPLRWLRRLTWWREARDWAGQVVHAVQERLQHPLVTRPQRIGLRLGRLAPRELIRYFYRSTLRRAAERGMARRPAQTPYEYGAELATRLPDAESDITALTESFIAAEYGPRPVGADDSRRARGPWERVRQRLRSWSSTPK